MHQPGSQLTAIMTGPLSEFEGFVLAVDCMTPGCRRDRRYAITTLAGFYSGRTTVGAVLRRNRCQRQAAAAWLEIGPTLNERVRPRSVPAAGDRGEGVGDDSDSPCCGTKRCRKSQA
jgi:hypothetical protein